MCFYCGIPRNRSKSLHCHKDTRRLGVKIIGEDRIGKLKHWFVVSKVVDWEGYRTTRVIDGLE